MSRSQGESRYDRAAIAAAVLQEGKSQRAVAKEFDCDRGVVAKAIELHKEGLLDIEEPLAPIPDNFSEPEEPVEDVIKRLTKNSVRRKKLKTDRTWMNVKVRQEGPLALLFVGDPHLDSEGCDWEQLLADIEVMKSLHGRGLAVNLGDQLDNWVGRLMEKYASSDMSMSTGRRLVKWLFRESGIPWWLILRGNHDEWHFSGELFTEYARPIAQTAKWEAKLTLCFPSGLKLRVWCAHDFPGSSIWHGLHGPLKASKMRDMAHIYACGDKHNWATFSYENADRRFTTNIIRARGYKSIEDEFAEHKLGKSLQREGGTIMVVVDPDAETEAGRCTSFVDLKKGKAFLETLLRSSSP